MEVEDENNGVNKDRKDAIAEDKNEALDQGILVDEKDRHL